MNFNNGIDRKHVKVLTYQESQIKKNNLTFYGSLNTVTYGIVLLIVVAIASFGRSVVTVAIARSSSLLEKVT